MSESPPPSRGLIILAFATVYLVWGSTYMAIRVAVETLPPFLMAAVRFLFAGLVLYPILRVSGTPAMNWPQWRSAIIAGNLLLLGGNGLVVWAEQTVASGRAALIVATTPAWFALLEWVRPGGARPKVQTVIGIAIGFTGILLLMNPGSSSGSMPILNVIAVVSATICWAGGSLYGKHSARPKSPMMTTATQMIAGGAGLLLVGLLRGEGNHIAWNRISYESVLALLYLIVFGSWAAFSAYVWLLKHTTPALLSTYAYVNPVIAVFLGWLFLHERMTTRTLIAAAVIVLGVIVITLPAKMILARWQEENLASAVET